jgi:hypothetical protein
MQCRAGGPRERLERVVDQLQRQRTDALAGEREVDHGVRPTADVDHGRCERLVHRHRRLAEAANAGAVSERLGERRPKHQRDVLDGVVLVDLEVAAGPDLQVEQSVMRQRGQQVVVEADAGRDVGATRAVEVEGEVDLGLAGPAADADPSRAATSDIDAAERRRHTPFSELSWRATSMSRSFS